MADDDLLTRATAAGRVLLMQDTDFLENGQSTPIGRLIEDAEFCLAGIRGQSSVTGPIDGDAGTERAAASLEEAVTGEIEP